MERVMVARKPGYSGDFESGSAHVVQDALRQQQVKRELRGETLTEAEREAIRQSVATNKGRREMKTQIGMPKEVHDALKHILDELGMSTFSHG
jgi:hypothetical protein